MSKNIPGSCPNHRGYGTRNVDESSRFDPRKMEMNSPGETELSEMRIVVPTSNPPRSGNIPCRNGACKNVRIRSTPRPENPWHFLKTVFLISFIIALIVWIIVYTSLVQYQIL